MSMHEVRGPQWGVVALVFILGCGSSSADPPPDGTTSLGGHGGQGGQAGAGGETAGAGPTNEATVFGVDPVSTPVPELVELGWVAVDVGGVLTSALDEAGVRKLRAWTCMDEGETNVAPGVGEQRICTLRQLANKEQRGSFDYQDWDEDVGCSYDPDNVHAEVQLYHHAQKIYELVTSAEVGVFDRLPGRHEQNGQPVPLHLVANYREPVPVQAGQLAPATVAFFLPHEYLTMGMSTFAGLEGLEGGDVLVFGQSPTADFAYAGETVYHEFGHAVVHATAGLTQVFADEQGLTNQPRALDEAVANTMAFIGSGESTLGEYLTSCTGLSFTFEATTDAVFPDDQDGHPVADGNPMLGALWEVYERFTGAAGLSRERFVRVLLLTLQELHSLDGEVTMRAFADAFVATLAVDGLGSEQAAVQDIFEQRGLDSTDRAKDISSYQAAAQHRLFMGCASTAPWNTVIRLDEGQGPASISTAYVQGLVTMPAQSSTLTITAELWDQPFAMAAGDDWDYRLFVRSAEPVHYEFGAGGVATVQRDSVVVPTVGPGPGGDPLATWTLSALTAGQTYYLHFVNYGQSEGILGAIHVETS